MTYDETLKRTGRSCPSCVTFTGGLEIGGHVHLWSDGVSSAAGCEVTSGEGLESGAVMAFGGEAAGALPGLGGGGALAFLPAGGKKTCCDESYDVF